jgi:hypothetical protein
MIICSSSNIDLIQGVSGYGTVADGATDWRIENTSTGVFNILNSPNLLAPNVSIIDVGNVGIGTIPITGTNKLQVQGAASVSGLITANTLTSSGLITANAGITVNTGSLTCANDTLSKTYTATNTTAGTNDILTMRYDTTNGIRFRQTLVAANDVRYDLIQKTNNVDYTAPVISFYKGNVGIGTTNPVGILQVGSGGRLRLANDNTDSTLIGASDANSATNPRIIISGITRSGNQGNIEYLSTTSTGMHAFYTTDSTTERLRIASNGNVGIGTTDTTTYKLNVGGTINATSVLVNGAAITAGASSQWSGTTNIYYDGGNVGIGTNNPQTLLDVNGKLLIRASTGTAGGTNGIFFREGYTADNFYNCSIMTIDHSGNTFCDGLSINAFDGISFCTGNDTRVERMRISQGGNVGIGTNNPTSKLHIINSSTASDPDAGSVGLYVYNPTNSAGQHSVIMNRLGGTSAGRVLYGFDVFPSYGYSIMMDANSSALKFNNTWNGSGTNTMVLLNNGNVGIGTTDATAKLTVISDNTKIAEFKNIALTAGLAIGYEAIQTCGTNTNQSIFIIGRGTGNIEFRTNDTANMVIGGDGYITYFGHKQPFSRCGTVSNSQTVDFPTLFGTTTTKVHTCEIVFQWYTLGTNNNVSISITAINNAGTLVGPNEVGYRDGYFNASLTGAAGNVIARNIEANISSTTKIRIVSNTDSGSIPRSHYICDTIYCWAGQGTTQNVSSGWLNAGDGNPTIRLTLSTAEAKFYGRWTATYYHV